MQYAIYRYLIWFDFDNILQMGLIDIKANPKGP